MRIIITIGLLIATLHVDAQLLFAGQRAEPEQSYFVNTSNDTVYGHIELPKTLFGRLINKVNYSNGEGFEYKLKAHETKAISLEGDDFTSKSIEELYYFLKPAVKGSPGLFYLEQSYSKRMKGTVSTSMAMMRLDETHTAVKGKRAYVDMKGRMHKIYKKHFKKQAIELFASYPEIVLRVSNNDLGWYDLDEIVAYCNYLNQGSATINKKISRKA